MIGNLPPVQEKRETSILLSLLFSAVPSVKCHGAILAKIRDRDTVIASITRSLNCARGRLCNCPQNLIVEFLFAYLLQLLAVLLKGKRFLKAKTSYNVQLCL